MTIHTQITKSATAPMASYLNDALAISAGKPTHAQIRAKAKALREQAFVIPNKARMLPEDYQAISDLNAQARDLEKNLPEVIARNESALIAKQREQAIKDAADLEKQSEQITAIADTLSQLTAKIDRMGTNILLPTRRALNDALIALEKVGTA